MNYEDLSDAEKAKVDQCEAPSGIDSFAPERWPVDNEVEQAIICCMLYDLEFLKAVRSVSDPRFFKNQAREAICKEAFTYYDKYGGVLSEPMLRTLLTQKGVTFAAELDTCKKILEPALHEKQAIKDLIEDHARRQSMRLHYAEMLGHATAMPSSFEKMEQCRRDWVLPTLANTTQVRSYSFAEFLQRPKAKSIVRKHIVEGSLALVFGESGIGKSFFSIDLAISIAVGKSFQGRFPCQQKRVLYLVSEAEGCFPVRLAAYMQEHNLDPDLISPNLRLLPAGYNFQETAGAVAAIKAALPGGWLPDVVFIDTLAMNIGGNENGPEEMTAYVKTCHALRDAFGGAAIVNVHHKGKDGTKGARGHTALTAASQSIIEVDGKPEDTFVMIRCRKLTNGLPFAAYRLNKEVVKVDGGDEDNQDSLVLRWGEIKPEPKPDVDKIARFADLFPIGKANAVILHAVWDDPSNRDFFAECGWYAYTGVENRRTEAVDRGLLLTGEKQGKVNTYYRPA